MDKVLLLGNNLHVDKIIELLKKRGMYSIVTDNLSLEDSPVKKMADEYWDISVMDIDGLEEKCRKEGINAVLCGASEVCMEANKLLCKRLGLPFYVSDRAYEIVNDKQLFKNECRKYGIPVAADYELSIDFNTEDLKKISYPVVVKPVDGGYSLGMHICYTEEELIEGYKDAYDKSSAKKVVVEKYYSGEEIMVLLVFSNGKATVIESSEVFGEKQKGYPFLIGCTPTKYMSVIEEKILNPAKEMFKDMRCLEGIGSIQCVMEKGELAVIEMNYRLPGAKIMNQEYICNKAIDFALYGKSEQEYDLMVSPSTYGYAIWLKKGVISKISGVDVICDKIKMVPSPQNKKVGDEVVANSGLRQIFKIVTILGGSQKDLAEAIRIINDNLTVLDENGNDMVYRYQYDPE